MPPAAHQPPGLYCCSLRVTSSRLDCEAQSKKAIISLLSTGCVKAALAGAPLAQPSTDIAREDFNPALLRGPKLNNRDPWY